jgi:hypothetical protein
MGTLDDFLKAVHSDVAEPLGYAHSGVIFQHGNDEPHFTAMACVYLLKKEHVAKRMANADEPGVCAEFWDFEKDAFVPFEEMMCPSPDQAIDAGARSFAEHAKFSQWPKSRKGYMHTKWRIGNAKKSHVLSLCNIHLFHDDINTTAAAETPSIYAKKRAGGLGEAMTTCSLDETSFFFGDFNIRLDAEAWVKWVKEEFTSRFEAETDKKPDAKLLDLMEKDMYFHYLHEVFNNPEYTPKMLTMDNEIQRFNEESAKLRADSSAKGRMHLHELDVVYAATYCLNEHKPPQHKNCVYNSKRIPAWCDRVVFTDGAKAMMQNPKYNAVHREESAGDHLPVYLSFAVDLSE